MARFSFCRKWHISFQFEITAGYIDSILLRNYLVKLLCALAQYNLFQYTIISFCFLSSLFAALCHFAFEQTVFPLDAMSYVLIFLIGCFPLGLAFYAWDVALNMGI